MRGVPSIDLTARAVTVISRKAEQRGQTLSMLRLAAGSRKTTFTYGNMHPHQHQTVAHALTTCMRNILQ